MPAPVLKPVFDAISAIAARHYGAGIGVSCAETANAAGNIAASGSPAAVPPATRMAASGAAGMAIRAGAAPGPDGVQTRMTESGADRSGPAMRITTGPSGRAGGNAAAEMPRSPLAGFHAA